MAWNMPDAGATLVITGVRVRGVCYPPVVLSLTGWRPLASVLNFFPILFAINLPALVTFAAAFFPALRG